MDSNDIARTSWRSLATAPDLPSLEQVRLSSDKFRRKIVIRNAVEYVACGLVVPIFAIYAVVLPNMMQRAGAVLAVIGTLFVGWQLYRRASPLPVEMAGTMPVRDYLRAQLVKQQRALASAFWWYILPFLPGLGLLLAGSYTLTRELGTVHCPWFWPIMLGTMALVIFGTWLANWLVARRLQRKIDELDALDRQQLI